MEKRVVALGFFDGVHIGHAELLKRTAVRAAETGATASVMTFDIHPDTLVFGRPAPLINSPKDREQIIGKLFGIDDVIFLHFNEQLMKMPWEEFISSFVSELNITGLVVGHDFTFGHNGEGNPARLREYCDKNGLTLDVIPPVYLNGILVSSTYIRALIEKGDMDSARSFLGHPHFVSDYVHSGYRLGTQMGMPTINMFFRPGVIVPAFGVYASKTEIDGVSYKSVTNIGVRPTVSDEKNVNIETHLLGYSGNLYGKEVKLEFYRHLRDEKRFASTQELFAQIRKDAEETEKYFAVNG